MKWRPRKYSRDPIEPMRNKKGELVMDKHGNPVDMRTDDQRREDTEDYRKWLFLRERSHVFTTMDNYDAATGVPTEQEYFRWKQTGKWDDKNGIIQEPLNLEYWHKMLCEPSF